MKLLFISYINRSGSTFLSNEFSKFSSILVCPEAEILFYYFIQNKVAFYNHPKKLQALLSEILVNDQKLKHWRLKISDFNLLDKYNNNFEIFIDVLLKYKDKVKPKSNVVIFKADTIAYYYNNIPSESYEKYKIKIISIIRDGRASYASQRETIGARTQKPMNQNPVKAAILWKNWISFLANYENNSHFIIVRYEELVINFQSYFDRLLFDIGIQKEEKKQTGKGDLFYRIPHDQLPMHINILSPPMFENIGKWKHLLPSSHINIFEKIAGEELKQRHYELMNPPSYKVLTLLLYIYYSVLYFYQSSILRRWIWRAGKSIFFKIKKTFFTY